MLAHATQLLPFSADAYVNHGAALLRLERQQEALECFERALALPLQTRDALERAQRGIALLGTAGRGLEKHQQKVALTESKISKSASGKEPKTTQKLRRRRRQKS